MNIDKIKQLDVGMSGISCKGKIGYVGDPRNVKGTKNGRDYDFDSQFVTIVDDTDEIGASLILPKGYTSVGKGQEIVVTQASLEQYIKDDKPVLKLKVRKWTNDELESIKTEDERQKHQGQPSPVRSAKLPTMYDIRSNAFLGACTAFSNQPDAKNADILKLAELGAKFIQTGKSPITDPNYNTQVDDFTRDANQAEQADNDVPF